MKLNGMASVTPEYLRKRVEDASEAYERSVEELKASLVEDPDEPEFYVHHACVCATHQWLVRLWSEVEEVYLALSQQNTTTLYRGLHDLPVSDEPVSPGEVLYTQYLDRMVKLVESPAQLPWNGRQPHVRAVAHARRLATQRWLLEVRLILMGGER